MVPYAYTLQNDHLSLLAFITIKSHFSSCDENFQDLFFQHVSNTQYSTN